MTLVSSTEDQELKMLNMSLLPDQSTNMRSKSSEDDSRCCWFESRSELEAADRWMCTAATRRTTLLTEDSATHT